MLSLVYFMFELKTQIDENKISSIGIIFIGI